MGFSKQCTKCQQIKWWYDFYKDLDKKFGIKSICKTCTVKQIYKYQQENKNEYQLYRDLNISITKARKILNTPLTDLLKLIDQVGR
jgi:hypothetical protein